MQEKVRAKKHLGQHFLCDLNIAKKTVDALPVPNTASKIIEVGPGMGVLTQYLIEKEMNFIAMDVDTDSVAFLKKKYPAHEEKFLLSDFLETDFSKIPEKEISVLGNFPYNISTQIMFKVLEQRHRVNVVVGMFQKEVAERIAEKEGTKTYGILSVLLQTFYKIEYLFTVHEHVFSPAPKVKSAVIRLTRNSRKELPVTDANYLCLVKTAFNQRRKTLRNSIKELVHDKNLLKEEIFNKRPEQLSIEQFIRLAEMIENKKP
jgi:16S rRNA (adenine1518-N6/adenine1519-N6)-dimethyltransferase